MQKYGRRSIRLNAFNYSKKGRYFITICTYKHRLILGEIFNSRFISSEVGEMAIRWLNLIPNKFKSVKLDEYIIMPDHMHAIIILKQNNMNSLPHIIQWYKTMTTNNYIKDNKTVNFKYLCGKLWQRNYYEHIIRNKEELAYIREYISTNVEAETQLPYCKGRPVCLPFFSCRH
ncbi:MAG: hypothetical protein A2Y62_20450 [Candidatus Fischerbacteria bacterium RBG_13_37_8]|uniref:Transposase IS200-like domain-containing protein n=1 Tax=Candidatus Fischerbacteria bacterium RBG_13_37_8 TaxID=1817863 RepID=A0A1F5VXG6_9BACT|nr:MAG: hypothetical protein A2Y62_20450 [Candidatus Fischerbacteria bacterium RBG_13_37_8]